MLKHVERLNVPKISITLESINEYKTGVVEAIICDGYPGNYDRWKNYLTPANENGVQQIIENSNVSAYFFDKMYVLAKYYDMGFDENFFRQSITDKDVYCIPYGFLWCLPSDPQLFIIQQSGEPAPEGYAKIMYTTESTVGDLFKRLHCYGYDKSSNTYNELPIEESEKNLYRYVKEYEIFKQLGDFGARISDYARIIKWLCAQVAPLLPAEQQTLLQPLIEQAPSTEKITELINREVILQEILNNISQQAN